MTQTREMLLPGLDVSRETMDRLREFEEHLGKWTTAINLVAASTADNTWQRHIIDSAQIIPYAPPEPHSWVDLGAGGGLPGIVVAVILAERSPSTSVTLIESHMRKATFLRSTLRKLGLSGTVLTDRIEVAGPLFASVVSARAVAPLPKLLGFVHRHMAPTGEALLLKGQKADQEIAMARKSWAFEEISHASITDPDASVLQIRGLSRV